MVALAKKQKEKSSVGLEIPVEFGNVSIGDETARLSLKIKKEKLDITQAEELLCGRRITGAVQLGGLEDSDGQVTLFDVHLSVSGTFDIHRFGVSPKCYTTGVTFKLGEIEVGDIAQFSKGTGRLMIEANTEIPHDVVDDDDDDASDNGRTLPGTFTTDQPWRKVSLDELFSGGILKSLKAAGLATVGDIHDYQQPKKNGWSNQLSDIKGLGAAKVTQVEERLMDFWRDNPQDE